MILISIPEACFHAGAPLAPQILQVNAEIRISRVLGNADARWSMLTAA